VSAIAAWTRLAAMQRISLLFIGTALVSGCASDIPQPHQAGMDVSASGPGSVHGITQETESGRERFVWCGECPPPTPKVSAKPGIATMHASSGTVNAGNWRKPAAVIHFDFNGSAIKSSEAIKLTGLLKGIGRNATLILRSYTDAAGSMPYNKRLAARRAKAVRRWLSTHTEQQIRYDIRAYGKCCYARQPGLSPENRRVEIYIKEEEER